MERRDQPKQARHSDHAGRAEQQAGAPLDPPASGARDGRGGAGHADHEQGGRDGLLGLHPGDVDQQREGEDRASAPEQAEGDADQHGEENDEDGHGGSSGRDTPGGVTSRR